MQTHVQKLEGADGAYIEEKCCIEIDGKKFCSGGSWFCQRADNGQYVGAVYAGGKDESGNAIVSSWDGTIKIRVIYGREYRNNFGALCCPLWFRYFIGGKERYFYGRWDGMEWTQYVRVREITEKSYFGSSYPAHVRECRRLWREGVLA